MNLDKRQWFVWWFFISLAILDRFAGRWHSSESIYTQRGTNLCHFVRVLFLWTPLVVALNLAVYFGLISMLTLLPIVLFGFSTYTAVLIGLVLLVVLIVVVIIGIDLTERFVKSYRMRWEIAIQKRAATLKDVSSRVKQVPHGPTFGKVMWDYIVAVKHKICPIINFKDSEQMS